MAVLVSLGGFAGIVLNRIFGSDGNRTYSDGVMDNPFARANAFFEDGKRYMTEAEDFRVEIDSGYYARGNYGHVVTHYRLAAENFWRAAKLYWEDLRFAETVEAYELAAKVAVDAAKCWARSMAADSSQKADLAYREAGEAYGKSASVQEANPFLPSNRDHQRHFVKTVMRRAVNLAKAGVEDLADAEFKRAGKWASDFAGLAETDIKFEVDIARMRHLHLAEQEAVRAQIAGWKFYKGLSESELRRQADVIVSEWNALSLNARRAHGYSGALGEVPFEFLRKQTETFLVEETQRRTFGRNRLEVRRRRPAGLKLVETAEEKRPGYLRETYSGRGVK